MILKFPQWCSLVPIRFDRTSVVNDTPQARAKLARDYQKFLRELREAVVCFGAERVEQDVHDIITGRQGRTPDQDGLNTLLLDEYDSRDSRKAKGQVNKLKLAREFCKTHGLKIKVNSVKRRLDRALDDRKRQVREQAEFDGKLRKPSLIGSGTK
jgi:hypothetical protein